jgi:hypothetical protein
VSLEFFLIKLRKKYSLIPFERQFSFSDFKNFLIAAFALHLRVMSEGISIKFALMADKVTDAQIAAMNLLCEEQQARK